MDEFTPIPFEEKEFTPLPFDQENFTPISFEEAQEFTPIALEDPTPDLKESLCCMSLINLNSMHYLAEQKE